MLTFNAMSENYWNFFETLLLIDLWKISKT